MTRPIPTPEPAPRVDTVPTLRTSAGVPTAVPVTITNLADAPRVYAVSALGVDPSWLPMPSRSPVLEAGESITAHLTLRPADGTLPARYPLVVAVQAIDPVTGEVYGSATTREVELVIGAPGQITLTLEPADLTAVYSKKFHVVLENSGLDPETVYLDARSPYSTAVDVARGPFVVAPATRVRIPGRLTVTRPTLFRRRVRHVYSVTARTTGAPRYTEGSLTARSVIGPSGAKAIAVLVLISVWVTLALFFVPKLADSVRKPQAQGGTTTVKVKGPGGKHGKHGGGSGGSGGAPSGGGSGGGAGGSGGGAGGSGGGAGGSGGGAAAASAGHKPVQLNGTVAGSSPAGVVVSLMPTTFGSQDASGASSTGTAAISHGPIGKLTPQADAPDAISHQPTSDRSVHTGADGAWSFANVVPVGFYVLQFSKPGYQTQRFIIDPTSAAATQPMKVTLAPGTGSLHGVVHNTAGGNVGAATITITDGTNTLTTSTISKGNGIGTWSVTGLSTPSDYLVSASHDGLGVASRLVSLAAAATSTVDLTMSSGVSTLTGNVHAFINGHQTPIGGAQVSATNGSVTRTASTVTTGSQTGTYVLPQLDVGTWTVNVSAAGYQLNSRQVTIKAGQPKSALDMALSPSTVSVAGKVLGAGNPLPSAGLTLANTTNTYKQTSVRGGKFAFSDVDPGTYTLTADYFGYGTQTQTVVAELGKKVKFSTFRLTSSKTVDTSTIAGYVGNAIASSGSLDCTTNGAALPPGDCRVYFALTDSDGNPVESTVSNDPNSVRPSEAVNPNGPTPYLISLNPAQGDGLKPGRYLLTISAPGYLPAKISINVPLNSVATAPQVNLFPVNAIAGRITTIGQINGDNLPIADNVPGQNCVVAVPVGYPTSQFNVANFVCDQTKVTAGKVGPDTITTLQQNCTNAGTDQPGYGIIENDGQYKATGLCDGQYNVYIVLADNVYDAGSQVITAQTVSRGQELNYSPHLARNPVVSIHVSQLNADTGLPVPVANNTEVTVECDTAGSPTSVSADVHTVNDVATLWGVKQGLVDCAVSLASVAADTGTQTMVDDQTYAASATVATAIPAVFGRIVSQYGSSDTNAVSDVTVTVHGITSYIGATPHYDDVPVKTTAQGCYAITADGTVPTTIPSGCGAFTSDNVATMTLRTRAVSVSTNAGSVTDPLGATSTVLAAMTQIDSAHPVPTVAAPAKTVSTSGLTVTTIPSGLNLTGATLVLANNSATAHGAGTITASINSTGNLNWFDSSINVPGMARQGTYTFDLNAPGFSPNLAATLQCGVFDDNTADDSTVGGDPTPNYLHCALSPATISAFGELSGTITAPGSAPPHLTTVPVSTATVTARLCPGGTCPAVSPTDADVCAPTATHYTASTDSGGNFDFISGTSRYMTVGTYVITMCAPGMIPSVVSGVTVTGGSNSMPNVKLQLLGGVSGVVTASTNNLGLAGVTVTLSSCADSACTTSSTIGTPLTTGSGGSYQFTGDTGRYFLTPGHYQLAFDATSLGFTGVTKKFDIDTADAPSTATSPTLTALGALGGTITSANSAGTPVGSAAVSLYSCTGSTASTCTTSALKSVSTDGSGVYQFQNSGSKYFLNPGYYRIGVGATSYQPTYSSVLSVASGDNLTLGGSIGDLAIPLYGSLSGTVTDNLGSHAPISNAQVVATCTGGSPACDGAGGATRTVFANSSGQYVFTGTATNYVFNPGAWSLTITATGFKDAVETITIPSGDYSRGIGDDELVAKGTLSGTIKGAGATTQSLSGALVTADECPASYNPLTSLPSSCTGISQKTTHTDTLGNYSFGTSTQWLLDPNRYWRVTGSQLGYQDNSLDPVLVASGSNSGHDVTLTIRRATQDIQVQIADSPARYTSHAIVTLTRNDDSSHAVIDTVHPGSPAQTKVFEAADLLPAVYTVTITGDGTTIGNNIQQSFFALNIPLVDAGQTLPTVSFSPSIVRTPLTGTVVGATGNNPTGTTPLNQIPVELFPVGSTSASAAATDLAGDPMFTQTGSTGTFSLGGIPNGTYDVRINGTDPASPTGLATPDPGYAAVTVANVTIAYGVPQNITVPTLARTTQPVSVTLTYDKLDSLSGGTPQLTSSGWSTLSPDTTGAPVVGTSTATITYTFNQVPWGCWAFGLPFASGHPGTVSTSGGTGSCSGISVDKTAPSTPLNAAYTLNEHVLTVKTTISPNLSDPNGVPVFHLVVGTVYDQPVTADGTQHTTTMYLVPNSYSVSVTLNSGAGSTRLWSVPGAQTAHLSSGSDTITISVSESALHTLTIPTYSITGPPAAAAGPSPNDVTYTVSCINSGCTGLGSLDNQTVTDIGAGGSVSLPNGDYSITAANAHGGGPVDSHHSYQTVTISGANLTASTTWVAQPH